MQWRDAARNEKLHAADCTQPAEIKVATGCGCRQGPGHDILKRAGSWRVDQNGTRIRPEATTPSNGPDLALE